MSRKGKALSDSPSLDTSERKLVGGMLKQNEEHYRELTESIDDVFFAFDQELRYTHWNKASEELTGISAKDALGKHLYDLFPDTEMTRRAEKAYLKTLRTKQPQHFVTEYQLGGKDFFFEISVYPLRNGLSVFVKDISKRKQAEEKIEHINRVLKAVRNVSQLISRERDRDRLLKFTCDNLIETRGYYNAWIALLGESGGLLTHAEAGLGKDFLPMVEHLKRGELTACTRRALRQSGVVATEDPFSACSGCPLAQKYRSRGAMTARLEYGGKVYGILSASIPVELVADEEEQALFKEIASDIAFALHDIELEEKRKRAEEALQESEQNFRALAENSADAIMIFPIDGTLLYANRRAPEMTGYSADELLHTTIKDLAPPQTFNEIMEKHQKRYKGKTSPQQYEGVLVRKDGESVKTEITATTTIWKGQPASMVVFRDLTERKQMERARVEQAAAIARAEEVQQSRQRIMSMQESLRKDIAQQIHGSVQNRLIVLLHQLTELERVASPGEMATELGDVRQKLEGVLENQVRPISHRLYPAILRRGLIAALQSLEDQCEALPAIKMELDEELMRRERFEPRLIPEQVRLAAYRIVEESLTNIIKHAKASKVTVGLELSSNGWLHLTVWDNGQGFNVRRASNGLGILMIHDYAEVVGGRCVIRSAPGKGTEVTATLPLSGPGAEQLERASPLE